jgi:hypothetical protein
MQYAISLPLILYDDDQVYKSLRPKTDMSIFRQINSLQYYKKFIHEYEQIDSHIKLIVLKDDSSSMSIPVTRYSTGMSKGLYFEETGSEFCGTFYYYEPESETYLTFESYRIYRNKFEAVQDLYIESGINTPIESPDIETYEDSLDDFTDEELAKDLRYREFVHDYFEDPRKFPNDLEMTPKEFENLGIQVNLQSPNGVPNIPRYIGAIASLVAKGDMYDQLICNTAKDLKIDIIIFTHMIGSHQIVPEVLDTRSRFDSFSHLAYPSNS